MPAVARAIPENRLKELLACATRVFIAHGYRRTQIADVARALVYLYVESKEALFAAALRHAEGRSPAAAEGKLPIPAPKPGSLVREMRERVAEEAVPPALSRALARRRVTDVRAELEEIVRALFAVSSRHRDAIKLIDRCGADHPELAAAFYREGRFTQLDLLAQYLEVRIRTGKLPPVPDVAVAARFVVEAIATWAVHIQWDPAPQEIDPHDAEETLVRMVVGGLTAPASGRADAGVKTRRRR
jgi:AcrR family transcriptional regulator